MKPDFVPFSCVGSVVATALAFCLADPLPLAANPAGATVAQGSATFNSSGSQLTVQTSDRAFINWQSFNIGLGETTTFVQPSSSSVVWNNINGGANPSQILGTLNANGLVVLQNSSGFYVGGQASINTGGLIMTTAPTPMPDLSGGGAWEFNAPPPIARIINYGQINVGNGGPAYLIAADIENSGTVSAPQGSIGLYAGKQVLVSSRPDGRGLSVAVTLPQGSVDNSGKLIADAGTIALSAQVVNQGGLIQANSINEENGVIDIEAADSLNLSASSAISARGGSMGVSSGGSVTLKSGNQFTDNPGSTVDISGGLQSGNGGTLEISAPQMNAVNTTVNGQASAGFVNGRLAIDPLNIQLVSTGGDGTPGQYSSGTVNSGDPPAADTLVLNVNSFSSTLSQISLQAVNNIEISTLWPLADSAVPATLTLQAGNNLTVDSGAGITAGKNWTLNLTAGSDFVGASTTVPGTGSIMLNAANPFKTAGSAINLAAGQDIDVTQAWILGNNVGSSTLLMTAGNNINFSGSLTVGQNWNVGLTAGDNFSPGSAVVANEGGIYVNNTHLTAANGNISLQAFNEVKIGNGSIDTTAGGNTGGNITVVTTAGDITTGVNTSGYAFAGSSYAPGPTLGGISTAGGGNVTLNAGLDVVGFPAATVSLADAGSGAFALNEPGVVNVTAARYVTGHFVAADSVDAMGNPVASTITAGQNAGLSGALLSLSLVKGGWNVTANSIDLQEVRNPNGVFNTKNGPYNHLFDYSPLSFVDLDAANNVELNGADVPRGADDVNVVYPPSLTISSGPGGVMFDSSLTLYPSPLGNLSITTTGGGSVFAQQSLSAPQVEAGIEYNLIISDSGQDQWTGSDFGLDHAVIPVHLNDPNAVLMNISGNLNDLNIVLPKAATIIVGGNMENSSFSGQNLPGNEATSITVAGQLSDRSLVTYEQLSDPLAAAFDTTQLINTFIGSLFDASGNPLFPGGTAPVFFYNPDTLEMAFTGNLSAAKAATLTGPLYQAQLDAFGRPEINPVTGMALAVVPVTFIDPALINYFVANTLGLPSPNLGGYSVGGSGSFNLKAGSMTLADPQDEGVVSAGAAFNPYLAPYSPTGANINITTTTGDLSMFASTINTLMGGDITINSAGAVNLGTSEDFGFSAPNRGVYTEAGGDINVTAVGDINLYGSRIATFDGGNITVTSTGGSVDAGNGAASDITVSLYQVDPVTGQLEQIVSTFNGSGIEALTLPLVLTETENGVTTTLHTDPNAQPGNITVSAYQDITASEGGIVQEPLNGNEGAGPTVTLNAGTRDAAGNILSVGNINVNGSGVIGGTVNLAATGSISGLVIGRQDTTLNAVQNLTVTVLSGGTANLSSGGTLTGTVFAVGSINVGGGGTVSATLQSPSVNTGNGPAQSTLAPATASVAATQAGATAGDDAKTDTTADMAPPTDDSSLKKLLARFVKRVTVIFPKI